MTIHTDETDKKIITRLQENSRESFVVMGKELGLSDTVIARRVKRMIDGGIISRFTVEMGDAGQTSAIVLASVDSATDTSVISEKLARLDAVRIVYEITGQYDIATIISAASMSEINTAIDTLRKIQGVTDTNTVIILNKIV